MTRRDFELIAGILAKHHATEEMVASFCAELAETNPRFDAQRFRDAALPLKRTVYVASAWWSDCDPFVRVVGNDPKRVEKAVERAMKDAAIDAYNGSEPEDKRKVRDFLRDIEWTGVDEFTFDAIVPQNVIAQYEANQIFHHPDMDFSEYQQLRDGERDAIVYLS